MLSTYEATDPPGWYVFAEQPLAEAFAPLYGSVGRAAALALLGLGLSVMAGLFLAGRMVRPIRAVAGGEAIFGPAIAGRLMRYFAAPRAASQALPSQLFPGLSDREREILALLASGWNNQDIAEQLHVSLKTVRNYVSNIFSKLQVADRAQAAIRAREAGFARDRDHGRT